MLTMISAQHLRHLVDWSWKNRTCILIHSVGGLRHHLSTKQCLPGSCLLRRLKLNYLLIMMRRTGCLRSFKRKDFIIGEYLRAYACTQVHARVCALTYFVLFMCVFFVPKPVLHVRLTVCLCVPVLIYTCVSWHLFLFTLTTSSVS